MVKKKSADSNKSSCSVYLFLGDGVCFLFFGLFSSVWLLWKWTKRNERSITPIYLCWNSSSFGLQWIWERREPWWKRNMQTQVNLLVPFTFSWVRVLVFCFLFIFWFIFLCLVAEKKVILHEINFKLRRITINFSDWMLFAFSNTIKAN